MRTARRWLTVLAAAVGLLIAGSPAITAQAGPAAPAQVLTGQHLVQARQVAVPSAIANKYNICLTNSLSVGPMMCQESNGTGQQVTINELVDLWSNFHTARTGTCGGIACLQIENGNSNCLRAGTNHVVKIESGSCSSGDDADWWQEVSNGGLQSWQYGDEMLTHASKPGFNVFHAAPVSGDWTNWFFQIPPM